MRRTSITLKTHPVRIARWSVRVLMALVLLAGIAALSGGGPASVSAQIGGLTVSVSPTSQTVQAGGTASFSYSISLPTTTPPFPTLTSVTATFGDGSSMALSPTTSGFFNHPYTNSGTFPVTVTAVAVANNGTTFTNSGFASVTVSQQCGAPNVTVSGAPNPATVGQVVTFSYAATQASGCTSSQLPVMTINYGDGTGQQGLPVVPSGSVTHVYSAPSIYNVFVTATSNGPTGTGQTTISVTGSTTPPTVSVTPLQTSVPAGQQASVSYFATAAPGIGFNQITSMVINWGDGTGQQGLTPPSGTATHVYASAGSFPVSVTATDSSGTQGTGSTSITVTSATPLQVTLVASPTSAPAGQQINFIGQVISAPSGTTTSSATINFGDGTSQTPQATGAGLIAQHSYTNPGAYTASISVTLSNGQTGQAQATVTITSPNVSGQPLSNVQIINAPATGTAGQPLSFSAATATTPNTGATISSYSWSFGDGGAATGQSVSHTYTNTGPFTVTLTVTDSTGVTGTATSAIQIAPAPGATVTYAAGWNLVAGPTGTMISGNAGPLYTFQAGNTNYQVIPNGTALTAPQGYWAYFPTATSQGIPKASPQSLTIQLPAGQFVMIGNAGNTNATVTGADIVYTYTPAGGYQNTATLPPGAGAWAYSANGATITITNAAQ